MADFKTRIDDLTGFGSTDDVAIVDWLTKLVLEKSLMFYQCLS